MEREALLSRLHQLHTTDLGSKRIRRNLGLDVEDVVGWCKGQIENSNREITRTGKNWYVYMDDCVLTVNAHSCTIITAHKKQDSPAYKPREEP